MCESAQAEPLTDYLNEKDDNRARFLTAIAVVAAGLGVIAVGGFVLAEHGIFEGISGISGGFLSSTFRSAAIFQGAQYSFHLFPTCFERSGRLRRAFLFPDVIWCSLNRLLEEDPSNTVRTAIITSPLRIEFREVPHCYSLIE